MSTEHHSSAAFSAPRPRKRSSRGSVARRAALGPNTNRGQKFQGHQERDYAVSVDWLTVVVSLTAAAGHGMTTLRELVAGLFPGAPLHLGAPTGRPRNFYPDHASLLFEDDDGGQLAGFVAFSDDAACITLSGTGCSAVRDWSATAKVLDDMGARITRCDVALDDFAGQLVTPAKVRDMWQAGDFDQDGRPPKGRYIDDFGTGAGCTQYVGTKGYKELCAYHKGRQLGDESSAWTRLEGRLYSKAGVIPPRILREPGAYLLGMYPVLATMLRTAIESAATRIRAVREEVIATTRRYCGWLKRQCGRAFWLLREAIPDETEFAQVLGNTLSRTGRPAAFRIPTSAAEIEQLMRAELCPS